MNPNRTRLLTLVVLSTLLFALPTFAGKRRAVGHPTNTTTDVKGVVLDSVTGAPVISARVETGKRHANTGDDGRFVLSNVALGTNVTLTVDRTGYAAQTLTVSSENAQNVTIRLVPEPTAALRKTDGSVVQLDYDSIEFGYLNSFAGYVKEKYEEFCRTGGEHVMIDRSEMVKIIGPAVRVEYAPCCQTSDIFKVNVELRNGTKTDVYFDDSCSGYPVEVIARNHVTGQYEYIAFTDTAELTFPATPASAAKTVRATRH